MLNTKKHFEKELLGKPLNCYVKSGKGIQVENNQISCEVPIVGTCTILIGSSFNII